MKKERKRVLLAWIMTLAMLFGVLQPAVGLHEVRAAEPVTAESDVAYEKLPQGPMKASAKASSHQESNQWGDGDAALAFDGNTSNGWHSEYTSKEGPHWIQWSLGGSHQIGRIEYQVKNTGANGRFKDIQVEVKNGGEDAPWTTVATKTLSDVGQGGKCNIDFAPVDATDVKITIKSSYNSNEQGVLASAGELNVYKVVPDLTATDTYTVIYHWEDENDLADVRPNNVAPTLIDESGSSFERAETISGNVTVSPGPVKDGYVYTFKKVPRYNKVGKPAQWTCNPGKYSTGYKIKTEKTGDYEFTATYTLPTRKQDKTIHVNWVGGDEENRPEIKIQLMYQQWDGSFVFPVKGQETATLNAANNYTYTWKDMVEYESGKEDYPYQPIYSIEGIDAIEGYEITYSSEQNSEEVYPFNTDGQLVITCTSTAPTAAVTVNVNNGTEVGGATLEDAIAKAGISADQVTSLEFVSGKVTEADLEYIKKNVNQIETFKLNLRDGLTYVDASGADSQVFPHWIFSEKRSLTTVELGGFTEISGHAFFKAENLTSVKIDDAKIIGSSAFSGAKKLTEVNLPNVTEISTWAFSKCKSLVTVNMPKVKKIREAAFLGSGYLNITLPESLVTLSGAVFGIAESYGQPGEEAEFHVVMQGTTPPTVIPEINENSPFKDAAPTSTLEVPEGSEDAYLNSEFGDAEKRTWCNLPLKSEEPVVNITARIGSDASGADAKEVSGASLEDMVKQTGLTPSFEVDYVEFVSGTVREQDIAYANQNLFGLKTFKLNLNNGLTYENGAGKGSTTFPQKAFQGKVKLQQVELGGFTAIGASAFSGQNQLTSITIPDVKEIAGTAFHLCSGLTEVSLPSVTKIKLSAFNGATQLKQVDMPVVEFIDSMVFQDCAMEEIHIPATITKIGFDAFGYSKADGGQKPIHFVIDAVEPPATSEGSPFKNCPDGSYLTVPEGTEEAYLNPLNGGDPEQRTWHKIPLDQKVEEATVTFDIDGTLTTEKIPVGEEIGERLPEEPKKDGFVFKGWNTAKDGSGTEVTAKTVVEGDMTVYAIFEAEAKPLEIVKIECSNDDGHGGAKWTNEDVTVTLTVNKPVQPMEGWNLDETKTVLTKVHGENGTYTVAVTSEDGTEQAEAKYTVKHIDKQAPDIRVEGTGNGEHYREITAIAVQDAKGVRYVTVNGVKTMVNAKDEKLTDIKALGVVEGENTAVVVDKAGNQTEIKFHYDTEKPEFKWIVDNNTQAQSKEVRLETSEEIQLPDPEWKLQGEENGTFVYVKTFHANWKDKKFTVTDLAGNVSDPQFVEVKRIDNSIPTVTELTQDITEWTKKDVTVTIKTSTDCQTPEGWKKVNKRTFTKVFSENGDYSVTLTSVTGVTGDAYLFSITNIDKEAPVIDYKAIEAANGYKREIPVNEGEEYTEEQLVEMFTEPDWVTDNSGKAEFKVDKWGLEHGLDGYKPFTSQTPGTYKVRFYAYDAAGNSSTFDVYVKVLEAETPEERTTTVNYTVFLDNGVRTGTWTHTGTEEGTFEFEVSMTGLDLEGYVPAEGETGSRTLTYGETTSVTFYLVSE